MSSTNKTSTIELSQYVSTDKPTYLVDYNGDMLKIDNAIAADRDSITTAQNKANTADGKADINKTSIDNLNLQVNGDPDDPSDVGIAGDLTAVEGTVNTVTALLGNGHPTTSDQTVIGAINGLEGAIAPREDGANLANSYSQGEQFARGGSVYEALTSLTVDTPFASLVLNTDYKVSDTLVEQIANAGGGAVLPSGYYIKNLSELVTVNGDDETTISAAIASATSSLLSIIQALANDEVLEIVNLATPTAIGTVVPCAKATFDNSATAINVACSNAGAQYANAIVLGYGRLHSTAAVANVRSIRLNSDQTVSYSDYDSNVLASGSSISIEYRIYKAFTT